MLCSVCDEPCYLPLLLLTNPATSPYSYSQTLLPPPTPTHKPGYLPLLPQRTCRIDSVSESGATKTMSSPLNCVSVMESSCRTRANTSSELSLGVPSVPAAVAGVGMDKVSFGGIGGRSLLVRTDTHATLLVHCLKHTWSSVTKLTIDSDFALRTEL